MVLGDTIQDLYRVLFLPPFSYSLYFVMSIFMGI
jgi:hypothetical protein